MTLKPQIYTFFNFLREPSGRQLVERQSQNMAKNLAHRLQDMDAAVAEISRLSGNPGLSYGVIFRGQKVHSFHWGFRDVGKQLPPDDDTLYAIGSCTKAFTSALTGALVAEGKLSWDSLIRHHLDGFATGTPSVGDNLSPRDLLAHRMGLTRSNQLWHGKDNQILIDNNDAVRHFRSLKSTQPFRTKIHYNNWGYTLAGTLIEHVAGESWGSLLRQKTLSPLDLHRTFVSPKESGFERVAIPYAALKNRSNVEIAPFQVQDGTLMSASQGLWSTLDDLLKWCRAVTHAYNSQASSDSTSHIRSPLKQIVPQLSQQIPMMPGAPTERSYGMGWARVQLPGPMGGLGCNSGLVDKMPDVSRQLHHLVIYNQGSLAGYTTAIILVPEVETGIVVLTNSIALNDAADWIGQMVLESVLEAPEPNDFVALAESSAEALANKFPHMAQRLESQKVRGTSPRPLSTYFGEYFNEIKDFKIQIRLSSQNDNLELAFQGLDSQVWPMAHYHYDTFVWLMSYDDAVSHARFPYPPEKLFKIEFVSGQDGKINSLLWNHDMESQPEKFWKKESVTTNRILGQVS